MEKHGKLYKIGDFAALAGVTVATLLFYEKKRLIIPELVDEYTGYRYYNSSQLTKLFTILQLKNFGFTIEEIRKLFNNSFSFEEKLKSLEEKRRQLDSLLLLWKSISLSLGTYSVIVKTIPAHYAVSIKSVASNINDIEQTFVKLTAYIRQNKLPLGKNMRYYARFSDDVFTLKDMRVEAFCEVLKCPQATFVPTQLCASVIHNGAYDQIGNAYQFLTNILKTGGVQLVDSPIEEYVETPFTTDAEPELLTIVSFPIDKVPDLPSETPFSLK